MNIDISTQLFYYVDIVLVFAGAGALLWALYYYRIINRLQKSIISQDRNRLLPSSTFLFFISFVVIGYRLLTKHGVFLGTFAYYEDTLSSALLFSSAIFILYATHIFRKTFLEINNEFSMVFENVSVGIHTVGPKGTIDSFNPKFLKISGGKRAEDLLGKRISDVPIYRNTGLDVIAQNAFSEQKQFDVETSLPPDVSGKRTYYHFLGVPVVVAEDGAAKRMVVLAEDVTSRKQLEEDIKQHSEDLEGQRIILENVAENMPTGVILLDTAGKPVLMNNALRIFLGCSTDDVKKAYGRFLEKFSTIQINGLVEACLSGTPIKVPEVEIDNKTISLSSTCMTALNPKQKLGNIFFGHLIWMDDITEQRLLDRAKDDFISIASHEMRTPLTIIRGNASLVREELESGSCGPELLEKVLSIENGSVRLMKIVNDFLDIMRLEGNKIEFRKEKFDFVELTKEVLSELQKAAAKKNLYLKFNEPSDKLPFVVGDKERARQVVTNLTMNAVQYTNQGGIDVAIEKDGRFLRFLVSDTGIGIDKQSHGDLFKKFNTAGKVFVHSKEYGSGLGLYICKLLVEAMDGKVKLEKSEPGVGSTFGFYLQAADQ